MISVHFCSTTAETTVWRRNCNPLHLHLLHSPATPFVSIFSPPQHSPKSSLSYFFILSFLPALNLLLDFLTLSLCLLFFFYPQFLSLSTTEKRRQMTQESRLTDSCCQNTSIRHTYISSHRNERTHIHTHTHTQVKLTRGLPLVTLVSAPNQETYC